MKFAGFNKEAARKVIAPYARVEGPILLALQATQKTFGYVDRDAVEIIADVCNVSNAEVHGVLSYYTDFRTTPSAQIDVKVCVAEACQAVGSRQLVKDVSQALNTKMHSQALDESVQLDQVFCLGNCALGPAVMVDEKLIGRATGARVLQEVEKRKIS
jgi:formate dehydrogenase subunit gamma